MKFMIDRKYTRNSSVSSSNLYFVAFELHTYLNSLAVIFVHLLIDSLKIFVLLTLFFVCCPLLLYPESYESDDFKGE